MTPTQSSHLPERSTTSHATHQDCCVCGQPHGDGLGLVFHHDGRGGVEATWRCDKRWQGYAGRAHGGVIAMVLDGAMTHCLFAHDVAAVTGRLEVRYRAPLLLDQPVQVHASIKENSPPLFAMQAVIRQHGQIVARAQAKFMQVGEEQFGDQREPAAPTS